MRVKQRGRERKEGLCGQFYELSERESNVDYRGSIMREKASKKGYVMSEQVEVIE